MLPKFDDSSQGKNQDIGIQSNLDLVNNLGTTDTEYVICSKFPLDLANDLWVH